MLSVQHIGVKGDAGAARISDVIGVDKGVFGLGMEQHAGNQGCGHGVAASISVERRTRGGRCPCHKRSADGAFAAQGDG